MNILKRQTLHPWSSKHNKLGRTARFIALLVTILAVAVVLLDALDHRKLVADKREVIRQMAMVLDGHAVWVEGSYEIRAVKRKRPVYVLAEKGVE